MGLELVSRSQNSRSHLESQGPFSAWVFALSHVPYSHTYLRAAHIVVTQVRHIELNGLQTSLGKITQLLFGIPKLACLNKTREANAPLPTALIIEILVVHFYHLCSSLKKSILEHSFLETCSM